MIGMCMFSAFPLYFLIAYNKLEYFFRYETNYQNLELPTYIICTPKKKNFQKSMLSH